MKGPRGRELYQGESITIFPATTTAGAVTATNGTAVYIGGERGRFVFLLAVTAAATDAADTLDVYMDWSFDDSTYINGGHFTQVLGNGGAKSFYMIFDPSAPGTSVIDATSDASSGAVRPALFAPYVRGRYVIVDADADSAFTFSVTGYAISHY